MTFSELPIGTWFLLYAGSLTAYLKIGRKYAIIPPSATRWRIEPDWPVEETDPPE